MGKRWIEEGGDLSEYLEERLDECVQVNIDLCKESVLNEHERASVGRWRRMSGVL